MKTDNHNYFQTNDWKMQKVDKAVTKKYEFKNFLNAFTWMTEIAFRAEELDHHPEWKNVYNRVEVLLTTHDIGKISSKDLILAKFMDDAFKKHN